MLWAVFQQQLNPIPWFWGSTILVTILAALPVVVLFYLLVFRRWLAPYAGAAGAVTALLIAIVIYQMPWDMAVMAFVHGTAFGFLPVGWTIFTAMLVYNVTVETGQFTVVRRSVAGLSGDARIQAILIGFCFGAFLEGSAGAGTPVAICGAIMIGLGFDPFLAAVLCLIANTSPVAFGGLGTPLIVLSGVTDLPTETLSIMAGHQLPLMSFIVPLYMVRVMCPWKKTFEIWPALLVAGGSFAVFQYFFATMHSWVPGLVLYPMTDIGGGIFSMIVTAIFLQFWKPKQEWHFPPPATTPVVSTPQPAAKPIDPHAAEAATLAASLGAKPDPDKELPLTAWKVFIAWAPYVIMSIMLLLTGLVRQQEPSNSDKPAVFVPFTGIQTNYQLPIPLLHNQVFRDSQLHDPAKGEQKPERAEFNFAWLTAPGTAVFLAALLSMLLLRMNGGQINRVVRKTLWQMRIPIPTIACMLGLSYVTRYAGMDATLGIFFANTGLAYPFFAAILGWLGVFLTGTDAGSNALFGSLQKITATAIHNTGAFPQLTLTQAQVLISTANSTGGVMGKMIDAQSICVATAATYQVGKEADIFKAVFWHSIILASMVGLITLIQAYLWPFTLMVPHVP
jgi:lactate permease